MRKALITGITGQDGYYLAELLQSRDYEVHGIVRRSSREAYDVPDGCILHHGDMADALSLVKAVRAIMPDELYNMAAQSHVTVSFEQPAYTMDVNGLGVVRLLETIKEFSPHTRFYQAGTSEMFGNAPSPQHERTPFNPQSPYACAKIQAYHSCVNYRDSYGIYACTGILFNHESPRRGMKFVTRKIANAVAMIELGLQDELKLGRIDTYRDWGWAPEYMEAVWLMMQGDVPRDYVVATGETHSVEEFVAKAFECVGRDWHDHVVYDKVLDRPSDVMRLCGDPSRIKNDLGWEPNITFEHIVERMVASELTNIRNNSC